MDIEPCRLDSTGFVTAAEAWVGYRRGTIDAATYGIGPEVPGFRGPFFLFDEVIFEVAHRFGDELLLWDGWGRVGEPDRTISDSDAAWLDQVADLLIASDGGDLEAEHTLLRRYRSDDGLHPGPSVLQASPFGDKPIEVSLQRALTGTVRFRRPRLMKARLRRRNYRRRNKGRLARTAPGAQACYGTALSAAGGILDRHLGATSHVDMAARSGHHRAVARPEPSIYGHAARGQALQAVCSTTARAVLPVRRTASARPPARRAAGRGW